MIQNMRELEGICKKYPFVYEGTEEFFFIGSGICKKCTSEMALYYYDLYKKCIKEIGEENLASKYSAIDEDKLEQLLYYFRKVKAHSDIALEDNYVDCRKETMELLYSMPDKEQMDVLRQLRNFVNVFHYYHRMIIRNFNFGS